VAAWCAWLPLLVFLVLLDPLTDYLGSLAEGEHPRLWPYLADQTGTRDTGPLWFVVVVLVLSLAHAALRRRRPARARVAAGVDPRQLVATAAVITAGSFTVRLASPFAAETFSNLRWAAWPQAAGLFTLGVLAGQGGGWTRSTAAGCAAVGGRPSPLRWRWPCWRRRPW
jgi:glucans biosynthesis protein C